MAEYVQVLTTVSSEQEAAKIGGVLLERHLAACVQTIGPIVSRYRWQGALEEEREWQCLAKTEAGLYPEVEAAIRDSHSYEEPEILAIPILAGSRAISTGSAPASEASRAGGSHARRDAG